MNTQDIVKALGVKTYVVSVMPSFLQVDSSYVVDVPTDHDAILAAERSNGQFYVLHGNHALVDPSKPVQISAYKSAGQSEEKVFYAFIQNLLKIPIVVPPPVVGNVDVSSVDHKDVV